MTKKPGGRYLRAIVAAVVALWPSAGRAEEKLPKRSELIRKAVAELVKIQEEGGQWPYEGVYRVNREIPIGYRVGGTAVVASTLMHAAPKDAAAKKAVAKALMFVLKGLADPLMEPSTRNAYDVRVWGHACALEFLCQIRAAKAAGDHAKQVDEWIVKLIKTLAIEEIPGGGWNYANRRAPASFVTAPVAQTLLWARAQGEKVPDELLQGAQKVLEAARTPQGAFAYSGSARGGQTFDGLPGSCARSAACETTLVLLGGGSAKAVEAAVGAFFKHWEELEKRRKKTGTHQGPYRIAPYYFYYGHRYAAQAIALLPEKDRQAERDRLLQVILKTRDADGTWNDRVFARTRNYGTSMVVLGLLGDPVPMPPRYKKK
jgi:hypothetical protein